MEPFLKPENQEGAPKSPERAGGGGEKIQKLSKVLIMLFSFYKLFSYTNSRSMLWMQTYICIFPFCSSCLLFLQSRIFLRIRVYIYIYINFVTSLQPCLRRMNIELRCVGCNAIPCRIY